MKADMLTLVQQLKESEQRIQQLASYAKAARPGSAAAAAAIAAASAPAGLGDQAQDIALYEKKIVDLQKAIKMKDDKVRGYREIIIKLKEEFVKSEEEKALAMVNATSATGRSGAAAAGTVTMGADEMRELKNQVDSHIGLLIFRVEASKRVRGGNFVFTYV